MRSTEVDSAIRGRFKLEGHGLPSLAAAVFMIRDGNIPGCDITILEELDIVWTVPARRRAGMCCPASA
jgi:oleate hydratase